MRKQFPLRGVCAYGCEVNVEDGKLVIADYKTDRVRDIEKLRTLYKKQLELYSEALSKSLETEVKELIIYSIHLGDYITL